MGSRSTHVDRCSGLFFPFNHNDGDFLYSCFFLEVINDVFCSFSKSRSQELMSRKDVEEVTSAAAPVRIVDFSLTATFKLG